VESRQVKMIGTDWEHIYKETKEKRWIAVEAPLGIVDKMVGQ